jgi:predicted DNA-binding transcriptional regulator AlpA
MTDAAEADVYLTGPQLKRRYSRSHQTIWRWMKNPELGFPKPTKINGRLYFHRDQIESWERLQASNAGAE